MLLKIKYFGIFLFALTIRQNVLTKEIKISEFLLAGSGVNLPLIRKLVTDFTSENPEIKLKVMDSIGSTGGIKAVNNKKIHLGLISRSLKKNEKNWNLKILPYAKTALVFAVNPTVIDDEITKEDIYSIYSGKKKEWKDNIRIIVLIREETDSGAELLISKFSKLKEIFQQAWISGIWRIEYTDKNCMTSISRLKGAIGWADYGSIQIEGYDIKPLKFDGITVNEDNIVSGKYPFIRELSFVYKEPLPEQIQKFIAFVKSLKGVDIMRKYGYVHIQ